VAYWDYQARATWKIDDKNRIGIFAFGSYDDFAQVVNKVTDTILDGGFHRIDLRYVHTLERGTLRLATTLGYARSNNDHNNIRDLTASVRATLEERLSPTMTLRAGGTSPSTSTPARQHRPKPFVTAETNILYPAHVDSAIGGYADVVWQLHRACSWCPGFVPICSLLIVRTTSRASSSSPVSRCRLLRRRSSPASTRASPRASSWRRRFTPSRP